MLSITEVKKIAGGGAFKAVGTKYLTFDEAVLECIESIQSANKVQYENDTSYTDMVVTLISDFVDRRTPKVEGYILNETEEIMSANLCKDLEDSILGWGKLTPCRFDDSIREIQVNGSAIFVDRTGGGGLLREPTVNGRPGKIITFSSPEESEAFITRLLLFSNKRLRKDLPFVDGSTAEGYRVAASHSSVNSASRLHDNTKWPTYVIRKIGGDISQDDLEKYGTCAGEMMETLKIAALARESVVTTGTTGSGKTTSLNVAFVELPEELRVGVVQKPTEVIDEPTDEYGNMIANRVYIEAQEDADEDSIYSGSFDNAVTFSLRMNFDYMFFGELRVGKDFSAAARAGNTGTNWMSSFHANGIVQSLDRMALELQMDMHIDMESARELSAKILKIIAFQDRLGDFTRKMLNIAEVVGYDRVKKEYIINHLYEFRATAVKYESDGTPRVEGDFVKVGNLTEEFQRKLLLRGIGKRHTDKIVYDIPPEGKVLKSIRYEGLSEV